MLPEEIRALYQSEIFKPFRVELRSGRHFKVETRDHIWVTPSSTVHLVEGDIHRLFDYRQIDHINWFDKKDAQKELAPLAEKLGTSVEHIWNVLIRQAIMDGLSSLGTALLAIVAGVIAVFVYRYRMSAIKQRPTSSEGFRTFNDEMEQFTTGLGLVIVLLGCLIIFGNQFYWILTDFLNPEFYAYRQLPFVR